MEDADGNPKAGETLELMKKELKRLKVVDNREEPIKKGIETNYVDEYFQIEYYERCRLKSKGRRYFRVNEKGIKENESSGKQRGTF